MKKVKLLVSLTCIILCIMCLTACTSGKVKKGYKACLEYLDDFLYDPDSLKIKSAVARYDDDADYICYEIVLRAKNGFGAYTGYKSYYFRYYIDTGDLSCNDTFDDLAFIDKHQHEEKIK